jgi:hypothetical protein
MFITFVGPQINSDLCSKYKVLLRSGTVVLCCHTACVRCSVSAISGADTSQWLWKVELQVQIPLCLEHSLRNPISFILT